MHFNSLNFGGHSLSIYAPVYFFSALSLCLWAVGGNKIPGVFGCRVTHWVLLVTLSSLARLYFIHSTIDSLH